MGYDSNTAVAFFSYTSSLAYFTPLIGGAVADSYLGKYKTIIYFSIIYIVGGIFLASSAYFSPPLHWSAILGLILISLGTGGIKPCVSSFGYVLPLIYSNC